MKKIRFISIFLIFILCFLTHFLYNFFPNTLTSIFFPVNESIWEHMKMLFTTILLYHMFEYIYLKYKSIEVNNYFISTFISSIISIPIYLILFLPIYYSIGENMIVTFIILFIVILIVEIIHYFITRLKSIKGEFLLFVILTIISYIIFGYLTYYPPKNDLFFDTEKEKYGINYNI